MWRKVTFRIRETSFLAVESSLKGAAQGNLFLSPTAGSLLPWWNQYREMKAMGDFSLGGEQPDLGRLSRAREGFSGRDVSLGCPCPESWRKVKVGEDTK